MNNLMEVNAHTGAVVRSRNIGRARHETAQSTSIGRDTNELRTSSVAHSHNLSVAGHTTARVQSNPRTREIVLVRARAIDAHFRIAHIEEIATSIGGSDQSSLRNILARSGDIAGSAVQSRGLRHAGRNVLRNSCLVATVVSDNVEHLRLVVQVARSGQRQVDSLDASDASADTRSIGRSRDGWHATLRADRVETFNIRWEGVEVLNRLHVAHFQTTSIHSMPSAQLNKVTLARSRDNATLE